MLRKIVIFGFVALFLFFSEGYRVDAERLAPMSGALVDEGDNETGYSPAPSPQLAPILPIPLPRTFVSGFTGEAIYERYLTANATRTIPNPVTHSAIIGLAYWPARNRLYARVAPGNQIVVMSGTGQFIRSFTAQGVNPGCGFAVVLTCGLTIRWRDGHLFLDQPNFGTRTIVEVDNNGNWVRNITHNGPTAAISGLGYHQITNRLWVLFPVNRTIAELTLDGAVQRQFSLPASTFQPNGLAIHSSRNEIIVPGANGTALAIYDLQGHFLRDLSLNRRRAGFLGGGIAVSELLLQLRRPISTNP